MEQVVVVLLTISGNPMEPSPSRIKTYGFKALHGRML